MTHYHEIDLLPAIDTITYYDTHQAEVNNFQVATGLQGLQAQGLGLSCQFLQELTLHA